MKRIYLWIFLLFACGNLFAQSNIVQYEYWLNSDYASKVETDISPVQTFNWQTTIPCQDLDVGLHALNVRFKDDKGQWSPTISSYFYKLPQPKDDNTIVSYEYWLDNQFAERKKENASPSPVFNFSAAVPFDELEPGIHSFNIRFKDSYGRWSAVESRYFQKLLNLSQNKLTIYEYWLNDDYSKKVRMEIPSQQTFVLLDSVNCLSADKIINTISYRFLDDSGLWSSTLTENYYQVITISVNLTYTKSVLPGETPVAETGYPDYADVGFTLYNITKKEDITGITFQFPDIVLPQSVDVGDSIAITAVNYSLTAGFEAITDTIVVDNDNKISHTFNIIQRGFIRSNYLNSENETNVGIVFDSTGRRMAQYDYIGQALTTGVLPNGTYQLLSMAKDPNFNSLQNLSAFASTELVENTHYILQTLEVKSGIITATTVPIIPKLDENQLYYTTNNTMFSVNKALIALDNYVTLRSEVEFKEDVRGQTGSLKLIVDIPENCSFVNNSVMIGDVVFTGYTIQNNQLTVPLTTESDIVHFCIIPTQGGEYAPNGFIEFTFNSRTIRQPIGTAYFKAEGLKIYVPDITAYKTIPVKGIVPARSLVKVYDNDEFIGQTTALANGNWAVQCDLHDVTEFSFHNIRAEVTTPQSLILQTETQEVIYDEMFNEPVKVMMYNTAHRATSLELQEYVTKFDFLNPAMTSGIYWYWPEYPDFTFTIEFAKNDTASVSNIRLNVLTSSGNAVTLPTIYDPAKGLWVAAGQFFSNSLPISTQVIYQRKFVQYYEIVDETENAGVKVNINLRASQEEKKAKKTVSQVVREFYQIYDRYKKCGGDNAMLVQYYYGRVKILYAFHHLIPSIQLFGVAQTSMGSSIRELAQNLIMYVTTAVILDINNFPDVATSNTEALLMNIKLACELMDESPCDNNDDNNNNKDTRTPYFNPPAQSLHDPSGYVYEAVPSNRLQGVTASIYYQNGGGDAVLWDAEDYEQINPQTTDEYGEYGWDVPQGLWQVKYEKEGYETAYSAWLPVPPPQLNINIPMADAIPPFVKKAQGYEEGIEIAFGKFMQPATMTTNFITVTRNGADETGGTIILLDEEENPANSGESFVSKVRFVPGTSFLVTDEVILTVDSMVLSYAGKNMTDDFVQRIEIRKEVKSLTATPVLNLEINGKGFIEVTAEPADAAAGKKIAARSVSSALAAVTDSTVLDADGKAKLQVTGELPGSTQIVITLVETDVKTTTNIHIAMALAEPEPEPEQVETPIASIPSGSIVAKNTEVSLTSATEDADIYYTTDGSEPSVSTGSEYTQPIVLTEDVTIKAVAVKEGMSDSEIAVFEYTIDIETGIDQPDRTTVLFVRDQTLIIRGLEPGEFYTVYSVLGNVVTQGIITNRIEQQIPLPGKGIFIVSTPAVKAKVLVK